MMFTRSVRVVSPLASTVLRHRCLSIATGKRQFSIIELEDDQISIPALFATFPHIWLRDACQCPLCVHPSTRQKLHRSSDFASRENKVENAEVVDGGLRVSWSSSKDGKGEGHESFYSASFLAAHAFPSAHASYRRFIPPIPWTASSFLSSSSPIPYSSLSQPSVLLNAYESLLQDGLVFFSSVPTEETSDEKCELRKLAERLGTIRRTFYGETWDVRNVKESKNIAYTNLDLGLHMDLLYFKHPPRYQILHFLRNRVRGGQSLFVDALRAANCLRDISPGAFEILGSTPVGFQYVNDGHHLYEEHTTIELSSTEFTAEGEEEITSINYSPPFQSPLPVRTPPEFYTCLSSFVRLLEDPEACVTRLLNEGDAVVFDNRRVLHGRAGFEEMEGGVEGEGETSRWLKGCYLEEDPVLDRMRLLSEQLEK